MIAEESAGNTADRENDVAMLLLLIPCGAVMLFPGRVSSSGPR